MPHDDDFRRNLALGRSWELALGSWLRARKWFLLPAYDFSGADGDKAPKLAGHGERVAVPDLLAFKGDARAWVEVKYRQHAVEYRKLREMRTGLVPRRLWDNYLRTQQITGIPVWMVFVQEQEGEVVGQSLARLADDVVHTQMYRDRRDPSGVMRPHVFVPYNSLIRLASLEDVRRFLPTPRLAA
jgi:hypothetical protein